VEEYGAVEVVQENRTGTISREVEPPARSLSLSVVPDTGGYGDRLVLQGALTGPDPAGTPMAMQKRTSAVTIGSSRIPHGV